MARPMTDKVFERAKKEMYRAGEDRGKAAASWILDGNSSEADAQRLLKGMQDGDPEILDQLPTFQFGEWAGDSINEVLDDVSPAGRSAEDIGDDERDELLDSYIDGFGMGVQTGAEETALQFLGKGKKRRTGSRRRKSSTKTEASPMSVRGMRS